MLENKKIFVLKILVAALIIGGVVFIAIKKYQINKQKQAEEDISKPPLLLNERKTFQITDVNKNFYKAKNDTGQEVAILIPKGVTPHLVDIKEVKVGYYVELFIYREVSNGIIAHSLNVTATNPHKVFALATQAEEKYLGGIVTQINKDNFIVAYSQPGGANSKTYNIKVSSDTVFTKKIDPVSPTKEIKINFSNLALNQSVTVRYNYNSEVIQAKKVEILSVFQLPIGSAKK